MKHLFTTIYTCLLLCIAFDVEAATETQIALEPITPITKATLPPPVAQERPDAFSLELLGRGGLYSFNYDHLILPNLAIGGGVANYSLSAGNSSVNAWMVPLYANYYFTEGQHRFFATGGTDLIIASGKTDSDARFSGSGLAGVVGGGYEFRGDNGFLFRATPYAFVGKASGFWLGFSFGYAL